jgi:hypothetical protein
MTNCWYATVEFSTITPDEAANLARRLAQFWTVTSDEAVELLTLQFCREHAHCFTCGSPIVPASFRSRLPKTKQRIFDAVRRRPGISAEALCDAIWADDIDGGPLSGRKNIHVHVHQLNKLIAPHGIAVRASKWAGYRILALQPP